VEEAQTEGNEVEKSVAATEAEYVEHLPSTGASTRGKWVPYSLEPADVGQPLGQAHGT
jgi:hypothetical protein